MATETATSEKRDKKISKEKARQQVLDDFRLANISREMSLLGRKEVLTGKAKFGIFGDGKELAQIAMARFFENGDFRSGYYRDQTFMMAINVLSTTEFFAQLYAHPDVDVEPASAGRSMNGHFATRNLDENGNWVNLTNQKNSSADISPTAGQMPRLLGLAQASKVYRHNKDLHKHTNFSNKGNEVAFGTIGDASTSEGPFWETINAAGVLQVPMVISVWDDGHGISVPKKYQTTKESISAILSGFQRTADTAGYEIFKTKGWDYVDLVNTYEKAVSIARKEQIPVLIHVEEVTQPQGHSTSGSHERYKSKDRMDWEAEYDCIRQFGLWIVEKGIATQEELDEIQKEAKSSVKEDKRTAWDAFLKPLKEEQAQIIGLLEAIENPTNEIVNLLSALKADKEPNRKLIFESIRRARLYLAKNKSQFSNLSDWINNIQDDMHDKYSSHLYSETDASPLKIEEVAPEYSDDAKKVDGRVILRDNFENLLSQHPEVLIFGEDSGKIGDVNQGLEGLQEKFGELRVSDTGIRETTILGQGIGMAMRGLRPIAEIQYLDYLLYALQTMSDDLATVRYRTKGGQMAPVIVRTRGHRLEGIWHSGSPMGMIIHALRGIHVCVPRNLTQAAGFYNTLIEGDDPALIIEPLNAYRTKEQVPENLSDIRTPLGIPEIYQDGSDITLVSYGSTFNIVIQAAAILEDLGISCELIDVRTLLPFDRNHMIVDSLKKTNRIAFIDEDVPGGASAFMMQQVLEVQEGYAHLDSQPITIYSKAHRPAYGTDGDYFSKPSIEDIVEKIYSIFHEADPEVYPAFS